MNLKNISLFFKLLDDRNKLEENEQKLRRQLQESKDQIVSLTIDLDIKSQVIECFSSTAGDRLSVADILNGGKSTAFDKVGEDMEEENRWFNGEKCGGFGGNGEVKEAVSGGNEDGGSGGLLKKTKHEVNHLELLLPASSTSTTISLHTDNENDKLIGNNALNNLNNDPDKIAHPIKLTRKNVSLQNMKLISTNQDTESPSNENLTYLMRSPIDQWRAHDVSTWLDEELNMHIYKNICFENIKSGKVYLTGWFSSFECFFNL